MTPIEERIKELNEKATQMLLFLSFAIVAAATVDAHTADPDHVRSAMAWWVLAVFPVLLAVAPLKDSWWKNEHAYGNLRNFKVWSLRLAIAFSLFGAVQFLRSLSLHSLCVW
jgi:cytochrome bd-type quinol oxidase subunit 2